MPPAFADVPTDADYAMNLISKRVAAGLDVTPLSSKRQRPRSKTTSDNDPQRDEGNDRTRSPRDKNHVNWKKWGERAALGKAWADDGKRLFAEGQVCRVIVQLCQALKTFLNSGRPLCRPGLLVVLLFHPAPDQ